MLQDAEALLALGRDARTGSVVLGLPRQTPTADRRAAGLPGSASVWSGDKGLAGRVCPGLSHWQSLASGHSLACTHVAHLLIIFTWPHRVCVSVSIVTLFADKSYSFPLLLEKYMFVLEYTERS